MELVLLDCICYFHKTGGINGAAQVVHDLANKANHEKLAKIAEFYDNLSVRLGFLLDNFNKQHQAEALAIFARRANSIKPLNPAIKPLIEGIEDFSKRNNKWMLMTIEHDLES